MPFKLFLPTTQTHNKEKCLFQVLYNGTPLLKLSQHAQHTLTVCQSQHAPVSMSQHATVSLSQHAPVSKSQYAPVSMSQHAPVSMSQHAPVSMSQHAPVSKSQHAPVSMSQHAPVSMSQHAPAVTKHTQDCQVQVNQDDLLAQPSWRQVEDERLLNELLSTSVVRLLTEADFVSNDDLPDNFWTEDFSKVKVPQTIWDCLDVW